MSRILENHLSENSKKPYNIIVSTNNSEKISESVHRKEIAQFLVDNHFKGQSKIISEHSTGYSGFIYKILTRINNRPQMVIVKLTPPDPIIPIEKEPIGTRVYGTRYQNFQGAYEIMSKNGIPIPRLFLTGSATNEIPYHFQIMSLLDGISIREELSEGLQDNIDPLHEIAGQEFGKLHQITRNYDGWVYQNAPYPLDWKTVFFKSLKENLLHTTELNQNINKMENNINNFIESKNNIFQNPQEFVLSHIDGFQGMAKQTDDQWKFTGIIDIEDHKFCDQRMVLAGYELSLLWENRIVPKQFWDSYKQFKEIDPDYETLKSFYMLYYLLSWISIPYEDTEKVSENEKEKVIKRFEELIPTVCS